MKNKTLIKYFVSIILLGCGNKNSIPRTIDSNYTHPVILHADTTCARNTDKVPKYEIIRKPNGGEGVFDFMYIVYANKKYDHHDFDLVFNDIEQHYGGDKISIDVWDSKPAFLAVLAIYQKEDRMYNSGQPIRGYLQSKKTLLDEYDKHNIAKYDNNEEEGIIKTYPDEMGD